MTGWSAWRRALLSAKGGLEAVAGRRDLFVDRHDAGRRLAAALATLALEDPVVLALPRGGVVVGTEVAAALKAPLDLVLVRKLGAPGHEELAAGAVVDGERPHIVRNEDVISDYGISPAYLTAEIDRQLAEIQRRRQLYLAGRPAVPLAQRSAIVVDDGIATGATVRAALLSVRAADPRTVVLAVPVAPPEILRALEPLCDWVICLERPTHFYAVGQFYRDFTQVEDEEVVALLRSRP